MKIIKNFNVLALLLLGLVACDKDEEKPLIGCCRPISSQLAYYIVDSTGAKIHEDPDSISNSKLLHIKNPHFITSFRDTFPMTAATAGIFMISENPTYIRNEREATGTDTLTRIVFYNVAHQGDTIVFYNDQWNSRLQIFFQYNDSIFPERIWPTVPLKLINR